MRPNRFLHAGCITLAFPKSHQWIAAGTSHFDLPGRAEVYGRIRRWLAA
jgi:hypothetical protein